MAATHWRGVNLEALVNHRIIRPIIWATTGSIVTGPVLNIGNQYFDNLISDLANNVNTDGNATDYTVTKKLIPGEREVVFVEIERECKLGEYVPAQCVWKEICGPPYAICTMSGPVSNRKRTSFRFSKELLESWDIQDKLQREGYPMLGAYVFLAGLLLSGAWYIWHKYGKKSLSERESAFDAKVAGDSRGGQPGEQVSGLEKGNKESKEAHDQLAGPEAALSRIQHLEKQLADAQKELKDANGQLRKSRAETTNTKTRLEAAQEKATELMARQEATELEANQFRSDVEGGSDMTVEDFRAENTSLRLQLKKTEGYLKESRDSNAELNKVIKLSMGNIERLQALEQEFIDQASGQALSPNQVESVQEALRKAEKQIEKLQAEKKDAEENLQKKHAEIEEMKKANNLLERDLRDERTRSKNAGDPQRGNSELVKRLNQELAEANEKEQKAEAEARDATEAAHEEMDKLKAQQKRADKKHAEAIQRLEEEIQSLKSELSRTENELTHIIRELEDTRRSKGEKAARRPKSADTDHTQESNDMHDYLHLQDAAVLETPGSARSISEAEAHGNVDEAELEGEEKEKEKKMQDANGKEKSDDENAQDEPSISPATSMDSLAVANYDHGLYSFRPQYSSPRQQPASAVSMAPENMNKEDAKGSALAQGRGPSGIPRPKLNTGLAGKRVSAERDVERPIVKNSKTVYEGKEAEE